MYLGGKALLTVIACWSPWYSQQSWICLERIDIRVMAAAPCSSHEEQQLSHAVFLFPASLSLCPSILTIFTKHSMQASDSSKFWDPPELWSLELPPRGRAWLAGWW